MSPRFAIRAGATVAAVGVVLGVAVVGRSSFGEDWVSPISSGFLFAHANLAWVSGAAVAATVAAFLPRGACWALWVVASVTWGLANVAVGINAQGRVVLAFFPVRLFDHDLRSFQEDSEVHAGHCEVTRRGFGGIRMRCAEGELFLWPGPLSAPAAARVLSGWARGPE